MSSEPPRDELRLLKPREAFALMRVGKTKGFELLKAGQIPGVVKFGDRCTRIRSSVLLRWLEEEREGE
jgi:hypothetical protein